MILVFGNSLNTFNISFLICNDVPVYKIGSTYWLLSVAKLLTQFGFSGHGVSCPLLTPKSGGIDVHPVKSIKLIQIILVLAK